jgi:hypothetical protein
MRRAAISDRRRGAGRTFLFREVDDEVDLKAHRQRQGYSLSISTKKTEIADWQVTSGIKRRGKAAKLSQEAWRPSRHRGEPICCHGTDAIQDVRLS